MAKESLTLPSPWARGFLAKAITLIESQNEKDIVAAEKLLENLPQQSAALRVGISGAPGVGKSTLLENLGMYLLEQGQKVAVLAIDPSSTQTLGSVLGDKTRMPRLGSDERAFVRPSPSNGVLGGVTTKTNEVMRLCEAAGYNVIFVETVGVGQNEVAVCDLVDVMVLLLAPAAGDELQGIKRGVVEYADIIAVNKADGEMISAARLVEQHYANALSLSENNRVIPCTTLCISAQNGIGIPELWATIVETRQAFAENGHLERKRNRCAEQWLWQATSELILKLLRQNPAAKEQLHKILPDLRAGQITPSRAAKKLLSLVNFY